MSSAAIAVCGTVAGRTSTADWIFTRPFNSDGGDVDGYEIAYQQGKKPDAGGRKRL